MIFFNISTLTDKFSRITVMYAPLPFLKTRWLLTYHLFISLLSAIFFTVPLTKILIFGRWKNYLPYNLMLLSTSPREFLAMHLYDPKSCFSTDLMVNTIWSSNIDLGVLFVWYLSLVITMSPTEKKTWTLIIVHHKII